MNIRTQVVTDTLDLVLQASGCDQVHVLHKPRLLSLSRACRDALPGSGSSYLSGELAEWLHDKGMKHSRRVPYHPQTQGKIERWHQALNNRILLENYFLPGDLEGLDSAGAAQVGQTYEFSGARWQILTKGHSHARKRNSARNTEQVS